MKDLQTLNKEIDECKARVLQQLDTLRKTLEYNYMIAHDSGFEIELMSDAVKQCLITINTKI